MPIRVTEIEWETDGYEAELPDTVIVDEISGYSDEEIAHEIDDYLSDEYGFLHYGYLWEWV